MKFPKTVSLTWDDCVNRKHDFRDFPPGEWPDHIDRERTGNNIIFKAGTLEEAYEELFGDVIKNYNRKQRRADRKRKGGALGYLRELQEKVKKIKKEKDKKDNTVKPCYQLLLQVGDMWDTGYENCPVAAKQAEEILTEYYARFAARNPRLFIAWAGLHADESCPHLGITVISNADGYEKGLSKQVSLSRALAQQGYEDEPGATGFDKWIEAERQELERLARKRGIEIVRKNDPERKKLTQYEYQSQQEAIKSANDKKTEYFMKLCSQQQGWLKAVREAGFDIQKVKGQGKAYEPSMDDLEHRYRIESKNFVGVTQTQGHGRTLAR